MDVEQTTAGPARYDETKTTEQPNSDVGAYMAALDRTCESLVAEVTRMEDALGLVLVDEEDRAMPASPRESMPVPRAQLVAWLASMLERVERQVERLETVRSRLTI